jgi:hypothetical protein
MTRSVAGRLSGVVFVCEDGVTWECQSMSKAESVPCVFLAVSLEERSEEKGERRTQLNPVKDDPFYTHLETPPAHGTPPSRV